MNEPACRVGKPNKQTTDENYRYAFQGQEKDPETGMEAFELRLWDGRLGRWLTVDPKGQYFSPYLGMGNNPISRIDPDGGADGTPCPDCPTGTYSNGTEWLGSDGFSYVYDEVIGGWSTGPNIKINVVKNIDKANAIAFSSLLMVRSTSVWGSAAAFDGPSPIGDLSGGFQWLMAGTIASTVYLSHAFEDDYTVTSSPENEEQYVTLYRGVYATHPDYTNALRGRATPSALLPVGNISPANHNASNGGVPSYFTSWTLSRSVANYHANKAHPYLGVVLMKRFRLSQTVPSPDNFDELEVLIPGIVNGAQVSRPNNSGTRTAY